MVILYDRIEEYNLERKLLKSAVLIKMIALLQRYYKVRKQKKKAI